MTPASANVAIEANVARLVMEKRVARRFFFETDLLYHLGTLRAVVRDVPMPARYVVASDGRIVHAEVNPDYTRRPEPSTLLPVLRGLRSYGHERGRAGQHGQMQNTPG